MRSEVTRYTKTWLSDLAALVLELVMLALLVVAFAVAILALNWVTH